MNNALWLAVLSSSLLLLACDPKPAPKADAPAPEHAATAPGGNGASAAEGAKAIQLTPEQVRTAGIATAVVETRTESAPIQATATIEPAADRQARVGARVSGRISSLRAKVGDQVRAGQALAFIDSPELGRARADFLAALAMANLARETADREKALFERNISAEREWREAEAQAIKSRADKEAAENRLHALGVTDAELPEMKVEQHLGSSMAISSPIAGVVVEASGTLGQIVEPKDTIFTVMDLRSVWLQVEIYEQDLTQVRVGQRAIVHLKAASGEEFSGTVESVGAIIDTKSRTARVRIVLDNARGVLKPGMFATVSIQGTSGERRRGLYVPAAAVQRLGGGHTVFVVRAENAFEPRPVGVAPSGGEWIEVVRGLSAGERIVTNGSFSLKSELKKDELGGEE
jgi:cobalt-zinc-cadmium efflux system membrane fusion protein